MIKMHNVGEPSVSAVITGLSCGHPILVMGISAVEADRLAAGQVLYSGMDDTSLNALGLHLVLLGGENADEIRTELTANAGAYILAAVSEHNRGTGTPS